MKSLKLLVEYDYDFEVLGIISSAKDHKLAWYFNKTLDIHLVKSDDLLLDFKDGSKIYIANFIFEQEYSSFRLLKNKACEHHNVTKPYLLPELKDYDYLVVLDGGEEIWDVDEVIGQIKDVPVVQYISRIDISNLKSKENLIFK